jgi:hypothetical protein
MTVVYLESRKMESDDTKGEAANGNVASDNVVQISSFRKPVDKSAGIHAQIHTVLAIHGVDFECENVRNDYKIVSYVVQGMLDRSAGEKSDRSVFVDMLRLTLGYGEPVKHDDTDELFGDLLGQLDGIGPIS